MACPIPCTIARGPTPAFPWCSSQQQNVHQDGQQQNVHQDGQPQFILLRLQKHATITSIRVKNLGSAFIEILGLPYDPGDDMSWAELYQEASLLVPETAFMFFHEACHKPEPEPLARSRIRQWKQFPRYAQSFGVSFLLIRCSPFQNLPDAFPFVGLSFIQVIGTANDNIQQKPEKKPKEMLLPPKEKEESKEEKQTEREEQKPRQEESKEEKPTQKKEKVEPEGRPENRKQIIKRRDEVKPLPGKKKIKSNNKKQKPKAQEEKGKPRVKTHYSNNERGSPPPIRRAHKFLVAK